MTPNLKHNSQRRVIGPLLHKSGNFTNIFIWANKDQLFEDY
jgi:hypothetical protein